MRVLVIAKSPASRSRLARLAGEMTEAEVVGVADADEAQEAVIDLEPDVVLVEVAGSGVGGNLVAQLAGQPAELPIEALTRRESEVLQLMAAGMTNDQIGHALEISRNTVKFHVAAILGKLEAGNRAEAVARAMRLGWVLA